MAGSTSNPDYEGPYTVLPTTEDQELDTADKKAINNITVLEIPYEYGSVYQNGSRLIIR